MATFTVSAVTATFGATINGFSQQGGAVPAVQVGVHFATAQAWLDLLAHLTTGYSARVTLGGDGIVQWWAGAGPGTLTIAGIAAGGVNAMLVSLERNKYLPADKSMASATFLLLAGATVL